MNCHEFQEVMRRSIDGEFDNENRKEVGLHLAVCQECQNLINGDKFWDDALLSLLEREAPEDLRADILGDLDGQAGLSGLSRKKNLKLMAWGATRNNMTLWGWVKFVAFMALVYWLVHIISS